MWNKPAWMSDDALTLKLQMKKSLHWEEGGSWVYCAMFALVFPFYWWSHVGKYVRAFTQSWISCIVFGTGKIMTSPLSNAMHESIPNAAMHAHFLYIWFAADGESRCMLFTKVGSNSYAWLHTSANEYSNAATNALSKCIACFRCMNWLVTDQGSHFIAKLIKALTKDLKISHHFTTLHSSWANATVERPCMKILQIAKDSRSEWKLPEQQWPSIFEVLQKITNHATFQRLGMDKVGVELYPM